MKYFRGYKARVLRVVRGVVQTVRVVDGGVVIFRAGLKLNIEYSECSLTARARHRTCRVDRHNSNRERNLL